jgi:glucose-1-phosphate thymidylyltransferase
MSAEETVGIVPAAGRATRLPPLPCSKEVVPLGIAADSTGALVPRVACHRLLEQMRAAGTTQAFVVLGQGKWDIPAFLDDGGSIGLELAYLTIRDSPGVPFTVARALPFAGERVVIFGFPDLLLSPDDLFARLLERRAQTGADAVLALFAAEDPARVDMADVSEDGRVRGIVVKPAATDLELTWLAAVWSPAVTRFWRGYAAARRAAPAPELHAGDVFRAAIDAGLTVQSVTFPSATYRDVGTAADLRRVMRESRAG